MHDTEPVFDNCPDKTITVYADPGLTSAEVTYPPLTATDNSGTVTLTLVKGLPSGSRFEEGAHVIEFQAIDDDRNRAYCFFSVSVQVLTCEIPDYNDDNMEITCPTGYTLGSQCSIGCRSGLPSVGPNNITCEKDDSDPPKTSWDFSLDSQPFCRALPCRNLTAPLNGALACDGWDSGTFCNMMCNSNFDIPRTMSANNRFICGWQTGKWSPTDNVPDCTEARRPRRMVLPSEFYYFDGDCTTSTDVIKNNFIQALQNSPIWTQACPVPEDCTVENVVVTCGPTSGRKKRNVENHRYKREANQLLLTFKISIPFSVDGTSKENARNVSVAKLNSIADGIKRDVVNGVFSSVAPGFTIRNDSVNFDWEDFECPEGQISNYASVSCRTFKDRIQDKNVRVPLINSPTI
ncbi:uncharacterized protein LOC126811617, partial [Patella vulgata]|uniref:uncharacterized protein LOC126811617 n=1 Tax=Patella vulgata TaxID=6465 RepID=UPI0024A951F0